MSKREFEARVERDIRLHGLPVAEREYRFAAMAVGGIGAGVRLRLEDAELGDWRFDFAWPPQMVALECEGGVWQGASRHTTGTGYAGDCQKYNSAAELGWKVIRMVDKPVYDVMAWRILERLLKR